MRLSRDAVYRLIATAKGDVAATIEEQRAARDSYNELIDCLTYQLQQNAPGDLTITHESVRDTMEAAYLEYQRTRKSAKT